MSRALWAAGLSLVVAVAMPAGAQRADSSARASRAVDTLEAQAAARVADAVCDKRVVLLGELPEHAHARGFGIKARIIERLVTRCGFGALLFEAGSYDFFGLEDAIAAGRSDSLELALARAIGGLWWTRELAGWRRWLVHEAAAGRVAIGGIDDQPVGATAAYARTVLPRLVGDALPHARAAECRDAIARHVNWRYTATQRYDSTERARLDDCARLAAGRATAARTAAARTAERRTPDEVMLDDLASYFARERGTAGGGADGNADRDLVMAQKVTWWSARLPRGTKIVVWTASTHAARSRAEPMPMGAQLAERWGAQLAAVGFTALRGQWGRAAQPVRPLAALPPDALEAQALAGAAGAATTWAWLDRAALRSLGPVPSRLFGNATPIDWSTAFDGVLVIRDEAAPTYEPRR